MLSADLTYRCGHTRASTIGSQLTADGAKAASRAKDCGLCVFNLAVGLAETNGRLGPVLLDMCEASRIPIGNVPAAITALRVRVGRILNLPSATRQERRGDRPSR